VTTASFHTQNPVINISQDHKSSAAASSKPAPSEHAAVVAMSSSAPTADAAVLVPVRQKTFTDHSGQEVTVVQAPADAVKKEVVVVEEKKPNEKVVVVEKKPEEKKDVMIVEEKKPEKDKVAVVEEKKPAAVVIVAPTPDDASRKTTVVEEKTHEKDKVMVAEDKKPAAVVIVAPTPDDASKKTTIVEEKKPVTTTSGETETTVKETKTTIVDEKKPVAAAADEGASTTSTKTTTTTTTTVIDTFVISKPVGIFSQYKTPGSVNLVLNKDVVTNSVGKTTFKVRLRVSLPLIPLANTQTDPRQRHRRRHHQCSDLHLAPQMSSQFLVRRAASSPLSREEHPSSPLQD
jgi:hypothetical protein